MKNNFVAKYARTFNKSQVYRDRTKYKRPVAGVDRFWEDYWEDAEEDTEENTEAPCIS